MLQKLNFKPGFNKMVTDSGAESQWVDGDFVRFRYGLPEKIGGWNQLSIAGETLPGAARAQHTWTSLAGEKYAAIGTSQGLFLYYGEQFFDITPLDTAITGCTLTTVNGSNVLQVNKGSHGLEVGRYVTLSGVTVTGASDFTAAELEVAYEILTVATVDKFTVQAVRNEGGSGMTAAGAATVNPYVEVGPVFQTVGYGWSTSTWNTSTWGTERATSSVVLDPGNWSLDNYGQVLVATIRDGKTFTWNAGATNARTVRASLSTSGSSTSANPTASRLTQVSDRDRHLFHFGTETTIGDPTTQDPMFIRFSNQEDLNDYAPTAVNTAGTFRLDKGNRIVGAVSGKDYTLPCLVEDFVFTTTSDNLGINFNATDIVYAEHNTLYGEVNWFYPKSGSDQIDRCVTYNYSENVWTTSSLARTSYVDTGVFDVPYATEYSSTGSPVFPDILGITNLYGATTYYAHEVGTDQVNSSGTTSINAFIESGDFDITAARTRQGQTTGMVDYRGDGEFFMSVKRFIPDFKVLTGNSKITLLLNDYPNNTASSSPLGPFTITNSTDKVDTRARGRLVSIKIENDGTGETWRYGTLRLDAQPDGRR